MKKIYLFDYHTQSLDHEKGSKLRIEKTIEAAITKGLAAICLTDHFPLPPDFTDLTKDLRVRYPEYAEKVLKAKEKYKKDIEVFLGAEFDWLDGYEKWIEGKINQYPFDYVIGSVHYIQSFPIDYEKKYFDQAVKEYKGIKRVIQKYYQLIREMAQSKLFDSIGHLDRIKVFNDGTYFRQEEEWYKKEVVNTLDIIAKTIETTELNTSGLYKACREQYPSTWILKETKKRGIDLTLGSDAHVPEKVGRNLETAVKLAKSVGYTSLVRFKQRKKIEVSLETKPCTVPRSGTGTGVKI